MRSHNKLKPLYLTTTVPMPTKLGRVVTNHAWLLPIKSHDPLVKWTCKFRWQTKKIVSPLTEWLCNQTWQNVNLPWWASTHKVTWPFNHVACKITWQTKKIISTTTILMATKVGRVVTHNEELSLIQLHDLSITWFVRSRDKLNISYLHLHH